MNYDENNQNLNQDVLNDIDEIDFSMSSDYNRAEVDKSLNELIEGLSLLSIDSDDNSIELETRNIKQEKPSQLAQDIVGLGETTRKTYSINMLEEGIKSGEISEIDLSKAIDRDLSSLGIDDKIDVNMYLANPYALPVENILDVMAVQSALTGVPLNVLMGIESDDFTDDSLANISRDIAEEDIKIKKSIKEKINNTKSKSLVDKVISEEHNKKKKPLKDKKLEKMMIDFEKEKQKIIDKGLTNAKSSKSKSKRGKVENNNDSNIKDSIVNKPKFFKKGIKNKGVDEIQENPKKSNCNLSDENGNCGSKILDDITLQDGKENLEDKKLNSFEVNSNTNLKEDKSNIFNEDITNVVDTLKSKQEDFSYISKDFDLGDNLKDNFEQKDNIDLKNINEYNFESDCVQDNESEDWFSNNIDDNTNCDKPVDIISDVDNNVNKYIEEDFSNIEDFQLFSEESNKQPNYSLGGDDIVDYPLTNKIMGVPNSKVYSLEDISQRVSENERLDIRRGVRR